MYDVVIIGSGPGGLTAGIYGGRAGLDVLIVDKNQSGGTVNNAPFIENYPGIDEIPGNQLMKQMTEQCKKYCEIREFINVEKIEKTSNDTFLTKTRNEDIESKYVIIATGTTPISLDSKGVSDFVGRGISYCAMCDGNFFIDREVLVIGGGNTAVTEAIYLNNIGVKCSLVHRRDKLRCEKQLADDLKESGIKVYWNSTLKEVQGENTVEKAVLHNKKTNEDISVSIDGIFISIGDKANNELAISIGADCDEKGYIITDNFNQTSVERVYAVGDVIGQLKQIIVACGHGAIAASHIAHL